MTSIAQAPAQVRLSVGEPAPWFRQASTSNPRFVFDTAAGRYIVLSFFGTAGDERGRQAIEITRRHRALFDDDKIAFFGVSLDPADQERLAQDLPGIRYFWDFDGEISRLYGAIPPDVAMGQVTAQRLWFVLDPSLRIRAILPFAPNGEELPQLVALLKGLPALDRFTGAEIQAPVLHLPNVFEPQLCAELVGLYQTHGGEASGFMRDQDGKTVLVTDPSHKRRADHLITDQRLIAACRSRILRRIVPEILKVHQFQVTRMERHIVACYDAANQGFFRAHRDNTTKGTAHRRFAVTINLNDTFEGGELCFPEYGTRRYKPPVGGAVVFSCSLLHAVTPVTKGTRYAYLPFLYDEAAALIREANNPHLGEGVGAYSAGKLS